MHGAEHSTPSSPPPGTAPDAPPRPPPDRADGSSEPADATGRSGPDDGRGFPGRTHVSFIPPLAPADARAGQLVAFWRLVLGGAWLAAFFAYAAVWQASVQLGIATWWIGPRSQPTSAWIRIIPFLGTIAVAICVLYNLRRIVWISAAGAALAVVFALPDLDRSTGLAVVELMIAAVLAIVTALATTGRYRLASGDTGLDATT